MRQKTMDNLLERVQRLFPVPYKPPKVGHKVIRSPLMSSF